MADVFISYHEKTEGAIAAEIASKLESAGITCWYAKRDVPPGGDFTHEVITQIENCKVFLLLLDEGAARSPHVETEVGNAFGHKKIVSYQTDKKNVKNVEWVRYYLKHVQIVPLPDYGALTKEIARALGRPVKTVTPKRETFTSKPQSATSKSESQETTRLKYFGIAFLLVCIIAGNICGFFWGRHSSFNWFLLTPLDDVLKGVLGAFVGWYVSWAISSIIWFKMTHSEDSIQALAWTPLIWLIIGLVLAAMVGDIMGGISMAICSLIIVGFICIWLLVFVGYALDFLE